MSWLGDSVGSEEVRREVVRDLPWLVLVLVKDNLMLNNCILARLLFRSSWPRLAHSLVLCIFWYRSVARLPESFQARRDQSTGILKLSQCPTGLRDDNIGTILTLDNGIFDDVYLHIHWCLQEHGACGGEAQAGEAMVDAAVLSIGHGCPVALVYRRKDFDWANGWSFRYRAQHRIGERTFTKATADEAEREVGRGKHLSNGRGTGGGSCLTSCGNIVVARRSTAPHLQLAGARIPELAHDRREEWHQVGGSPRDDPRELRRP